MFKIVFLLLLTVAIIADAHRATAQTPVVKVYVAYRTPTGSISFGQKRLLIQLVGEVQEQLAAIRDGRRIDSVDEISAWSLEAGWETLAAQGKTHFLIALPDTGPESGFKKDVIKVRWQLGALGVVSDANVPVFVGNLRGPLVSTISSELEPLGAAATQKHFGDKHGWQPQPVDATASEIVAAVKAIFPELSVNYSYYLDCFAAKFRSREMINWKDRQFIFMTNLIEKLEHPKLRYFRSDFVPQDEVRALCSGSRDSTAMRDSDYYLRGTVTRPKPNTTAITVIVDNRASQRRLGDSNTAARRVSDDFADKLRKWSSQYESSQVRQISACPNDTFWTSSDKHDVDERLAKFIRTRLLNEQSAKDTPGKCGS